MARKPSRVCIVCKNKWSGLYNTCLKCRQKHCSHTEIHYDGTFAMVCVCGKVLRKAKSSFDRIGSLRVKQTQDMLADGIPYAQIATELNLSLRQVVSVAEKKVRELPNAFVGTHY